VEMVFIARHKARVDAGYLTVYIKLRWEYTPMPLYKNAI